MLAVAAMPGTARAQAMHSTCPQITVGAAQVGGEAPMTFTRRAIDGRTILVAEGGVVAQTPAALSAALAQPGTIDEIWLRSPGGHAMAGNQAAEVIRKSGIPVRIPTGWWCISACNFLFFGGAIRMIDAGGQFGVHMATVVNDNRFVDRTVAASRKKSPDALMARIAENEQQTAMLTASDIDVVLRMGISRKLLSEVMYTQRADTWRDGRPGRERPPVFRCLSQAEMRRYNVINVD